MRPPDGDQDVSTLMAFAHTRHGSVAGHEASGGMGVASSRLPVDRQGVEPAGSTRMGRDGVRPGIGSVGRNDVDWDVVDSPRQRTGNFLNLVMGDM
jgi:hypothetical protein